MEMDPAYDPEMIRESGDTTAILKLAKQFLDMVKQNQIDEALNLLQEVDSTGVKLMTAERRAKVKSNYQRFPVLSYDINEFKLFSEQNTDVRFTYEFMPKPEGKNMPNTMKGILTFRRYDGKWYMTISPDVVYTRINNTVNNSYIGNNN